MIPFSRADNLLVIEFLSTECRCLCAAAISLLFFFFRLFSTSPPTSLFISPFSHHLCISFSSTIFFHLQNGKRIKLFSACIVHFSSFNYRHSVSISARKILTIFGNNFFDKYGDNTCHAGRQTQRRKGIRHWFFFRSIFPQWVTEKTCPPREERSHFNSRISLAILSFVLADSRSDSVSSSVASHPYSDLNKLREISRPTESARALRHRNFRPQVPSLSYTIRISSYFTSTIFLTIFHHANRRHPSSQFGYVSKGAIARWQIFPLPNRGTSRPLVTDKGAKTCSIAEKRGEGWHPPEGG